MKTDVHEQLLTNHDDEYNKDSAPFLSLSVIPCALSLYVMDLQAGEKVVTDEDIAFKKKQQVR